VYWSIQASTLYYGVKGGRHINSVTTICHCNANVYWSTQPKEMRKEFNVQLSKKEL
jgi:hypothetical protein